VEASKTADMAEVGKGADILEPEVKGADSLEPEVGAGDILDAVGLSVGSYRMEVVGFGHVFGRPQLVLHWQSS